MSLNRLFQNIFRASILLAAAFLLQSGAYARAGEMLAMNSHSNLSQFGDAAEMSFLAVDESAVAAEGQGLDNLQRIELKAATDLPERNLWEHIRAGLSLPELDTPLVGRHERWYASKPDYVLRMTERARLYLYYIVREVERRGMPMDIALLPMIESAFNPAAYSVASASGIWQFIPSTGRHFGMEQNWWHDDRRDIISATNGALDYLQKLHDQFGDWQLALAAYNCGERCIERAQIRNRKLHKPTDFLSLKLPKETRNYVPKLLAMKHIINDPASFGLVLEDIPNEPYFAAIAPERHIDVELAASLAEMSMDDFKALNPANSRPVILHGDSTLILLPATKVDTFMSNLESHDKPLVSWQPYQSRNGELLEKIAAQFGISTDKLKKANGIPSTAKVSNGQKLLVPATDEGSNQEFAAFNMHLAPTLDETHLLIHIVRHGETLGSIARRYHVNLASLKARNGHHSLIRPGQRLIIAGAAGLPGAAKQRGKPAKAAKAFDKATHT